jgi:anti-sigma factor RsiW
MNSRNDRFTERLSDYLDHDLPRAEYDAVERHLEECADCRDALAGLNDVKSRAAALVDPPMPSDLWAGIASRIGTAGSSSAAVPARARVHELPRQRSAWLTPQWLVAAAAFVVVASGALWLAHDRLGPALRTEAVAGRAVAEPSAHTDASAAGFDAERIEGEIGQLQQALERGRGKLDPKTVQVLEDNLRIIRKATEDARRALEADPANIDLQDYLAGSVQRKLELVRRAATMAGV